MLKSYARDHSSLLTQHTRPAAHKVFPIERLTISFFFFLSLFRVYLFFIFLFLVGGFAKRGTT